MFIMDMPYVPAQETPIVLAQVATAGASANPQPDFILNACKETESTGDPKSAMRGVYPAGWLAGFLSKYENKVIDAATRATIKTTLLQDTTHGKLNRQVSSNGSVYFMYDPTPNYIGNDRAVFLAEFEGKVYKIVVELHVFQTVGENDPSATSCPPPKLIKVTKPKPSSGATGTGVGYNLTSVTFADLTGSQRRAQ